MASEYLKWKYRDVKPDPKPEYTKEEKRKNWWYYHKWHVVGGIIGALLALDLILTALGVKEDHPDVQVALVTDKILPSDTVTALEDYLEQFMNDANGDGEVMVKINTYALDNDTSSENAIYMNYASEISMMADFENCMSYIFIINDPEQFQKSTGILSRKDGTLPEEEENGMDMVYAWNDLSLLRNANLGTYETMVGTEIAKGSNIDLLKDLYIGRGGFWTDKHVSYEEDCIAFYEKLTQ